MTQASRPQPRLVPRGENEAVRACGQNVGHTPAWALERGYHPPGPEVLCTSSSELVLVGSRATKVTPLRGNLRVPRHCFRAPRTLPKAHPPHPSKPST